MLYLLDANVLITANSTYYPLDQIPEFWSWVHHQAESNRLKIPREIMEEIKAGRKNDDPLLDWNSIPEIESALLLDEFVCVALVQHAVSTGYAADLSDDEVEKIGRDPFLIAYALADPAERTVVTIEVSRPSAQRSGSRTQAQERISSATQDGSQTAGSRGWTGDFQLEQRSRTSPVEGGAKPR